VRVFRFFITFFVVSHHCYFWFMSILHTIILNGLIFLLIKSNINNDELFICVKYNNVYIALCNWVLQIINSLFFICDKKIKIMFHYFSVHERQFQWVTNRWLVITENGSCPRWQFSQINSHQKSLSKGKYLKINTFVGCG